MIYIIFRNSGNNKLFVDKTFENIEQSKEYLISNHKFLNVGEIIYKFPVLSRYKGPSTLDSSSYHVMNIEYVINHVYSENTYCHINGFIIHNGDFVTQELSKLVSDYKVKSREEKINQII